MSKNNHKVHLMVSRRPKCTHDSNETMLVYFWEVTCSFLMMFIRVETSCWVLESTSMVTTTCTYLPTTKTHTDYRNIDLPLHDKCNLSKTHCDKKKTMLKDVFTPACQINTIFSISHKHIKSRHITHFDQMRTERGT